MATATFHDLQSFLKHYTYNKKSGGSITHTRIGDKKKIYGGVYSIPPEKLNEFYNLYYNHVFEQNKPEYLTEKQEQDQGGIVIDFDFRYEGSVKKRQHTSDHIIDMIDLYITTMKEIVSYTDDTFQIYIFEKPEVNHVASDNITKDGIHMIIGVKMSRPLQLLLREKVLKQLPTIWEDLPITNTWESVLDEGISQGYTNWQLYGSRKPANQAYKLTSYYDVTYDSSDGEFNFVKNEGKKFNTKDHFVKLSAQYKDHIGFEVKPEAQAQAKEPKKKKSTKKSNLKIVSTDVPGYNAIKNMDDLDSVINSFHDQISTCDYKLKETHDYTMILPDSYYGPGSRDKWIRVGWALYNTSPKLFPTWLKFSSRDICRNTLKGGNGHFNWAMVPELFDMWRKFDDNNIGGLTYKSIMYWAKHDSEVGAYKEVKYETVDYFIEESLKGSAEFDLANVLHQLFKDQFICVSIKNNIWYEFKHHRWHEIDSGNTLRLSISQDMHSIYTRKVMESCEAMNSFDQEDSRWSKMRERTHTLASIAIKLKKTTDKNNIMREARELFYDNSFLDMQDSNPYLLCFNNGVMDFKENGFRPGKPEDYLTKTTNNDYIPIEKIKQETLAQINVFMEQLFPIDDLRRYMWDHLASCLIGTTENQTFNIYTGNGRNGKSKLVELMGKCLGEYKGTVPITLITSKRPGIGSTSSEIVQLKGIRYAVMQEPSKNTRINEGIMKEITGGDPIQGRALFKDTVTFIPQFNLVVCTNTLFEIESNDGGTWRRIRVCDYMSKFNENPVDDDPDEPYQFIVDKKIEEKFDAWKFAFMAKLVDISKRNKGAVKDCDIVLCKSLEYREGQDYLTEFVKENIKKTDGGKIKKGEVQEQFKQWYQLQYGRGVPKGKELFDFMDKKFGKYKKGGWHNVSIIYDEDENNEDE